MLNGAALLLLASFSITGSGSRELHNAAISTRDGPPVLVTAPNFEAFGPSGPTAGDCLQQEINIHTACGNLTRATNDLGFLSPTQAEGDIFSLTAADISAVASQLEYPGETCCQVIQKFSRDGCDCDPAVVAEVQSINKKPEFQGVVGPDEDQYQQIQHVALFLNVCKLPASDFSACNPTVPTAAPPADLPFNTGG